MGAPPRPGTMRDRVRQAGSGQESLFDSPVPSRAAGRTFRSEPAPQPSRSGPRPRREPGIAPNGYRQEFWHLAMYFTQSCEARGVSVKGLPIVYEEIRLRAEQSRLEAGDIAVEFDVTRPRPDEYRNKPLPKNWNATRYLRDLYRDEDGRPLTWVQVGEAIIDRFWTDPLAQEDRTGNALADLCDVATFGYLHRSVCDRWRSKRSRKRFDEMIAARNAAGYEPEIVARRPRGDAGV